MRDEGWTQELDADLLPTMAIADQENRANPAAGKKLYEECVRMCLVGRGEGSGVQARCSTEVADENHVVVFVSEFADNSSGKGVRFYEDTACTRHDAAEGIDS